MVMTKKRFGEIRQMVREERLFRELADDLEGEKSKARRFSNVDELMDYLSGPTDPPHETKKTRRRRR